jgi:hypothetical protein
MVLADVVDELMSRGWMDALTMMADVKGVD